MCQRCALKQYMVVSGKVIVQQYLAQMLERHGLGRHWWNADFRPQNVLCWPRVDSAMLGQCMNKIRVRVGIEKRDLVHCTILVTS